MTMDILYFFLLSGSILVITMLLKTIIDHFNYKIQIDDSFKLKVKTDDSNADVHTKIDSGVPPYHSGPGPRGFVPAISFAFVSKSVLANVYNKSNRMPLLVSYSAESNIRYSLV